MRMCERARDAWEGHHKMPIDLADPALSRDEEARRPRSIGQRANFRSAGRFRDLRPAVWEARNSRRKKEEKKIDEADVRGKEKRQAEMRGWLSSPRSFVVHNKERGKRKIQDIPWATWYRQQRERKRKNSTDGSRTAGRTSTHPVVPICDQRGQQDVSRISLTRFSGKYLARLNFCAWFSTRVLVTCTIYNTGFSRQQKKHVTATMGWFFFFFYLGSEGDSRPGWAKVNAIVSLLPEEAVDRLRKDSKRESMPSATVPSDGRVRGRVYLYLVVGNAFACFRDRKYSRERKKCLRAANNVAQLRS